MFKNIPEYIIPVLDALEGAGYEAYLVGGCVRDRAMGKEPNDYDVTTNAKPHEMEEVFRDYRVIETGLKHGTLTVVSMGECVEITTYRIDGEYADNRHPTSVSFTDDVTLDLSRRDFTVNAMAYSRTLGLCDPFGGMDDLVRKMIVCVGSPTERFSEDGLRILRALRFASVLEFTIDSATSDAIHSMKELLRGISKERIYTETRKLLCGGYASQIMKEYADVLSVCVEGISPAAFEKAAEVISSLEAEPVLRAAYICRLSADAENLTPSQHAAAVCKKLKTSAADAKRASLFATLIGEKLPEKREDIKYLMGRLSDEDIKSYAAVRTVFTGDSEESRRFMSEYEKIAATDPCVKISQLAIGGCDVIEKTGAKGAAIGKILAWLLDGVICERFTNTREELLTALESIPKDL